MGGGVLQLTTMEIHVYNIQHDTITINHITILTTDCALVSIAFSLQVSDSQKGQKLRR